MVAFIIYKRVQNTDTAKLHPKIRKMETRVRRRVALALVTFIQLRIVLGVPLDRSNRAASRDNAYNQLVGTLAAGVNSVLEVMVSGQFARLYIRKLNAMPP